MESPLTAPARTERDTARDRIAAAAVWWVSDQACSEALAELEEAVEEALAVPPEPGSRLAEAIAALKRDAVA